MQKLTGFAPEPVANQTTGSFEGGAQLLSQPATALKSGVLRLSPLPRRNPAVALRVTVLAEASSP